MKSHRITGAASAVALALTLALGGAGAAQAAPEGASPGAAPSYVALGDSYSSGVGAGSYQSSSGDCKRSDKAYPALWSAAHRPASFAFTACSGARTGDVLSKQLAPLTPTTGLVSISVGGNDAGFADAMSTCVLNSDSVCLDRIATASAFIRDELPAKLDAVYSAISARSPKARVVVLGYPRFYKLDAVCVGLSEAKRKAINNAADLLDSVTAKRAADHGFAFGDVNTTFAGHELCSGSPWLRSVTLPVDESYHPTAAGQSGGYLPVFSSVA
ncbi:SGNH/GDSL hydrolase family protein [Streptomyces mobaraensis NBRC 13819 = DSM 40847]|uniref:triacylglycerol lipase n=2 Tax=Streptomyces mobaraensis TaxID=35621 RepID=A0A5N5VZR8_STRMB|nr:SGNH/GDSL hydrolase family protein [Streptomyces mobaraensis]EME99517.1 triacylglycerol lipase [Streptomyces mobaraensis NBRC 13819 = DSM 40847]KAB7833699.1 SGNH/GDSL hydrolase family protein [Streptomyces mobaraensis]QTT73105.1 SGNH/GDSL hydrolase family protein [Streptomyces mobaraensis NBRC 13819 = DSM 40847]